MLRTVIPAFCTVIPAFRKVIPAFRTVIPVLQNQRGLAVKNKSTRDNRGREEEEDVEDAERR